MAIDDSALDLDRILVALADPTRRAILQQLSPGEARVTELGAAVRDVVERGLEAYPGARAGPGS